MKTSNLSRITPLWAIGLALIVVWLGVSVTSDGAENRHGAWFWVTEDTCCLGETPDNCNNGPIECNSQPVYICNVKYYYTGDFCRFMTRPCSGLDPLCDDAWETDCY